MNNAKFSEIAAKDIDVVVQMMADFYAIDNYPFDVAVAKGLLREFVENETLGKGWLIWNEDKPVGYVILTFVFSFEYKGRIAFLDELFIAPDARGKGFGKQAVDFIAAEAKKNLVKIIYLEVETTMKLPKACTFLKLHPAQPRPDEACALIMPAASLW